MQNLTEERTGQLIRELRLKAGWTQKELGMKIGISDKAISKWERGLSFPDITLLPRLAEVFHVSVGEIISGQQLSEPALNPEQLDDVVADTLAYSQRDSFSKVKRIFCLIFLPLIFSAMFLCAVINLAVNHQLSWALYPIGALTIVLVLTLALVLPKHWRLEIGDGHPGNFIDDLSGDDRAAQRHLRLADSAGFAHQSGRRGLPVSSA